MLDTVAGLSWTGIPFATAAIGDGCYYISWISAVVWVPDDNDGPSRALTIF